MGLDLSLTPTQASQTDLNDESSRQAERNAVALNAQSLNTLATHQETLPLKHYVFRRVPARRA